MSRGEARQALIKLARNTGILVSEIDGEPDVFVSCGLLSAPCVRMDVVGLHDIVVRMRNMTDRRQPMARAGAAATHARLVDLMTASRDLLREQSMVYYDPHRRIVVDRRNRDRFREAMRAATQRVG